MVSAGCSHPPLPLPSANTLMCPAGNALWHKVRQQPGETGRSSTDHERAELFIDNNCQDAVLALWCRSFMKHPTWGIKLSVSTLEVAAEAACADDSAATSPPTSSAPLPPLHPGSTPRPSVSTPRPMSSAPRPRGGTSTTRPSRASSAPAATPAQTSWGDCTANGEAPDLTNSEEEEDWFETLAGPGMRGPVPPSEEQDTASSPQLKKRQRGDGTRLNRSSVQLAQLQADQAKAQDEAAEEAADKRQKAMIDAMTAQAETQAAAASANVQALTASVPCCNAEHGHLKFDHAAHAAAD
jgi:hypothetical protein